MYKKYAILLYVSFVLLGMSFFAAEKMDRLSQYPAFQMTAEDLQEELSGKRVNGLQVKIQELLKEVSSKERKVSYQVLTKPQIENVSAHYEKEDAVQSLNKDDVEVLCRLVEAEAGGEDFEGKKLVAHVVLNRLEHEQFPDTVEEVVFDCRQGITQFSPIADGRYYQVSISEETREAVIQAINDDDNADGAIYFVNSEIADRDALKWFESECTYLFRHGNHEFFS